MDAFLGFFRVPVPFSLLFPPNASPSPDLADFFGFCLGVEEPALAGDDAAAAVAGDAAEARAAPGARWLGVVAL